MYGHNKRVPKPELEISDKDLLDSVYNETIDEAIRHFSPKRPRNRKGADDARYFFHRQEVEIVLRGVTDPSKISVKMEMDDRGNFFCYVMNFIPERETRARSLTRGETRRRNQQEV